MNIKYFIPLILTADQERDDFFFGSHIFEYSQDYG